MNRRSRALADDYIDRKKSQALQWISKIPYEMHARQAYAGTLKDTGQWLLGHEKFRQWELQGASSMLWLRGDRKCTARRLSQQRLMDVQRELAKRSSRT
jgi:hypothetical protein